MLRTAHDSVQQTVDTLVKRDDVSVVVTTGATGVGPGDVTIAAIHPLVDKALPGFGELFRRRYAKSVGTDVVATRAMAGIVDATPVFCLPGDPEAARLGVSEIVVEQAERLASQARSDMRPMRESPAISANHSMRSVENTVASSWLAWIHSRISSDWVPMETH